MGNYITAEILSLFLILGLTVPCLATTYIVPWRTSLNLTIFPLGKTFYVGDVLDFLYTPYTNAVFLVDSIGFAACTPARGVALGIMGNTSYTLPEAGYFYFISFFNDCLLGQKLAIRVSNYRNKESVNYRLIIHRYKQKMVATASPISSSPGKLSKYIRLPYCFNMINISVAIIFS